MAVAEGLAASLRARLAASPRWRLAAALPGLAPRLTALAALLTAAEGALPSIRSLASGALVGAVAAVAGAPAPAGADALWPALLGLTFVQVSQFAIVRWRATAADGLGRRLMR